MATLTPMDRLSDDESADLRDRVQRFRTAWQKDGSTGLGRYIPPPGVRHRVPVLVQVILVDMELRAAEGLPFPLASYLGRFPEDLTVETLPVALLAAEFRLRHQFADKPDLDEYRAQYPRRYDELTRFLAQPTHNDAVNKTTVGPKPPGGSGAVSGSRRTVVDSRLGPPMSSSTRGSKLGDLVTTSADIDATPPLPSGRSTTPGVTGGTTILPNDAPYHLVRKLGSGAFGEVFEALAPGGVRVAVKRILRTVDHATSLSEREALDTIKNLAHPFLLKTNAYWVFDDRLVIVMELADDSLAGRIEHYQLQGRLGVPPEELIPLFEQAGEALDYLHSQSISHRDIKPENVLILKGYAKVADFGLARPHEHTMTVVGNTVGTPAYMAPEMWQQKVSLQSDQYSLAATYVRARLGRALYETTVLLEMAHFHVHEAPDLNPLPAAEQAVLMRALAKDPDERFPTCLEFARALRAAVLDKTLTAESPALGRTGRTGSHAPLPGGTGSYVPVPSDEGYAEPPVRPSRNYDSILRIAAAALACALAVGLMNRILKPSQTPIVEKKDDKDKDDKDKVVPAKVFAKYPDKWVADEKEGTRLIGEKHYHNKLTRMIAGETVAALLVYPTRDRDLPPFYMFENKVTNRVFLEMWNSAQRSQFPLVTTLRKHHPHYIPEMWRKGAENLEKDPKDPEFYLGINGPQAGVPVTGVTLPEAIIVAQELGGLLPTHIQWRKAAGGYGDDLRAGPAGPDIDVPPDLMGAKAVQFRLARLRERNLALGLKTGPWPVEKRTNDLSEPFHIHQLVTNGQEWLGVDDTEQPISLATIPIGPRRAYVVGRHYSERSIATFDVLQSFGAQLWESVAGQFAASFRVVLIPQ